MISIHFFLLHDQHQPIFSHNIIFFNHVINSWDEWINFFFIFFTKSLWDHREHFLLRVYFTESFSGNWIEHDEEEWRSCAKTVATLNTDVECFVYTGEKCEAQKKLYIIISIYD